MCEWVCDRKYGWMSLLLAQMVCLVQTVCRFLHFEFFEVSHVSCIQILVFDIVKHSKTYKTMVNFRLRLQLTIPEISELVDLVTSAVCNVAWPATLLEIPQGATGVSIYSPAQQTHMILCLMVFNIGNYPETLMCFHLPPTKKALENIKVIIWSIIYEESSLHITLVEPILCQEAWKTKSYPKLNKDGICKPYRESWRIENVFRTETSDLKDG